MRRWYVRVAAFLIGLAAAYFLWFSPDRSATRPNAGAAASSGSATRPAGAQPSSSASATLPASATSLGTGVNKPGTSASYAEADFPIAAPLNAPGSTVARDLDILSQIFEAWQSNFPREGNPVGENAEITAALMGANGLEVALIPKGHRAVNERGELCDRWGTPFRFHQLSGTRMEIRSAGPDRKFATEDDAVWTPQ